jgi:hypothetical protein
MSRKGTRAIRPNEVKLSQHFMCVEQLMRQAEPLMG